MWRESVFWDNLQHWNLYAPRCGCIMACSGSNIQFIDPWFRFISRECSLIAAIGYSEHFLKIKHQLEISLLCSWFRIRSWHGRWWFARRQHQWQLRSLWKSRWAAILQFLGPRIEWICCENEFVAGFKRDHSFFAAWYSECRARNSARQRKHN